MYVLLENHIFVVISLEFTPSESDVLHLPDEISRQIAICNDDYKFAAFHIVFCSNLQLKIW